MYPMFPPEISSILAPRQFSYALDLDKRTQRQGRHTDARPRRQLQAEKVLGHIQTRSDQIETRPYRCINLVKDIKVARQVCQVDGHFDDVRQIGTSGFEPRLHVIEGSFLEME